MVRYANLLDRFSFMSYIYRKYTMNAGNMKEIVQSAALNVPCCTLNITGKEQKRLVRMFKGLGNNVRLEIIKFLVTHPGCITVDVVNFLPLAQATVSQHLKVLKNAGWISGEVEGTATCYHLNADSVAWFREKVGEIF